jgi:hypothetical protein
MRVVKKPVNGKVWTNGVDIYGRDLILAEGLSGDDLYLISDEEYNAILEAQKKEAAVIYENEDTV